MLFRLYPFLATVFYLGLIIFSLVFFDRSFVWWVLGVGAVLVYSFVKKSIGKFSGTFLPVCLILGSLPFLSLMSTLAIRSVSIGILTVALYFYLLAKGRLNENSFDKLAIAIINGINFLVFFIWANLLFASFINFSEQVYPVWVMLLLSALLSFIISRDTLETNLSVAIKSRKLEKNDINLASILTSLLTSQITWALAFYPFRYRSSAMILLAVFYIFFTSAQFFLIKEDRKRKLAKDIIVGLVAIALVLITSKWKFY